MPPVPVDHVSFESISVSSIAISIFMPAMSIVISIFRECIRSLAEVHTFMSASICSPPAAFSFSLANPSHVWMWAMPQTSEIDEVMRQIRSSGGRAFEIGVEAQAVMPRATVLRHSSKFSRTVLPM
jgi:hypothetical protein